MKRFGALAVLCAFPASGQEIELSSAAVHTLSLIESVPSKSELVAAFPDPVFELRRIAVDEHVDSGLRLRAIRALPVFCPASSCAGDPAHLAVRDVFGVIDTSQRSGIQVLFLRAAIEALGAARSGDPADVDLLLPFLDHPSRDVRATTANALAQLCNADAIAALRNRSDVENVQQVRVAIVRALSALSICS